VLFFFLGGGGFLFWVVVVFLFVGVVGGVVVVVVVVAVALAVAMVLVAAAISQVVTVTLLWALLLGCTLRRVDMLADAKHSPSAKESRQLHWRREASSPSTAPTGLKKLQGAYQSRISSDLITMQTTGTRS
jgi:hypothetical protein